MPKPPNKPPQSAPAATTDWHEVADWYDQLVGDSGSEFHQHVVLPGILRMLAPQPTDQILDVACGQGVLCRLLATRGYNVRGVDAAPDLIAAAKSRGPESIHYQLADARDLAPIDAASLSAVTCILALQNIHPPQNVFASVARVLQPGGRFVIAIMHPCFRSMHASDWGWDDKTKTQYRRIERYLIPRKEPIVAHPGQKTGTYTWTFHRPLQDYIRFAANAGFLLQGMEEWPSHKTSTSGPRATAENTARKEIPMFMGLKWIKSA